MTDDNPNGGKQSNGWRSPVVVFAGFIVVGFAALVIFMIRSIADANWDRLVYIFGSVEALAFSAAGAVFGSSVQRRQTTRAETEADKAKGDLASAGEDALVGKTLGAMARAKLESAGADADQATPPPEGEEDSYDAEHIGGTGRRSAASAEMDGFVRLLVATEQELRGSASRLPTKE